ncbi:unnamed protein product [Ophioblennius macclurei]
MFFENANVQHPRQHHQLFLRSRPYRGELPAVAGLLLYPDTPSKMETTSREAFCFRPIPQQNRVQGHLIDLDADRSRFTSSRQTERQRSSKEREPGEDDDEGDHDHTKSGAADHRQSTTAMQSQYQKDFPPPSSRRRRRTPALPQPDNIGINPAFRIEFRTVQRETYPGWPIVSHRLAGRQRAPSSGHPNMTF